MLSAGSDGDRVEVVGEDRHSGDARGDIAVSCMLNVPCDDPLGLGFQLISIDPVAATPAPSSTELHVTGSVVVSPATYLAAVYAWPSPVQPCRSPLIRMV